jgi:hypothetical protein
MAISISADFGEVKQNVERIDKLGRRRLPNVLQNVGRDCLGRQNETIKKWPGSPANRLAAASAATTADVLMLMAVTDMLNVRALINRG